MFQTVYTDNSAIQIKKNKFPEKIQLSKIDTRKAGILRKTKMNKQTKSEHNAWHILGSQ